MQIKKESVLGVFVGILLYIIVTRGIQLVFGFNLASWTLDIVEIIVN